jgi:hypothetical protein
MTAFRNRTLASASLFLLASPTLFAQSPWFQPDFPADLKQYLNLTDAEAAFIVQANSDYNQTVATNQQRISQLQSEIAAETQKDPLDPMALGTRYAEIETIRRDLASQQKSLRDKLRASLDDSQRAKLSALSDARNLQPIISDAQCENLLDQQAIFPGNIIPANRISPAFVSVAGCSLSTVPADLLQYLALSSDQADTITSLNTSNQQQTSDRQQSMSQLQAQIAQETAKDTLDPMAIGTLYAQIETIRRDINSDLVTLRNNVRATLNDTQRVKLNLLDDARKLQPLISEATCQNLLDAIVSQWFDTSVYRDFLLGVPTPADSCGLPIFLTLTTP